VNLEIPFPPLEIQEGIMREIKILEGKETEMREKLVQTKQKIC
jgi:restriction endonuclease S subunit